MPVLNVNMQCAIALAADVRPRALRGVGEKRKAAALCARHADAFHLIIAECIGLILCYMAHPVPQTFNIYMRSVLPIILIGFLPAVSFAQTTAVDTGAVKQRLMNLERAWLDAYEENDVNAMRRILADGFTITGPAGMMSDKEEVIANLDRDEPNDPSTRQYTTDSEVRLFGTNVAVITGTYIRENDGEITSRRRYTDTYVKIDGRWHVAASSLTLAKWYGKNSNQ